jgi:hypothetical protein
MSRRLSLAFLSAMVFTASPLLSHRRRGLLIAMLTPA